MTIRTSPTLPADHGRNTVDHYARGALMRETDDWVHVGDYTTRKSAHNVAHLIRNGAYPAYRSHRYDAQTITTAKGTHEVWGQYVGERTR